MGLFDKITKMAEKAVDAVVQTSDKINQTYQKEGFDGIVNRTADSFTKAGQKTQDYFNNIGEKNKQIMDSIPDKDLEATLAKATAVVINTTQTIVKDAAKVTKDTVDTVSKNIQDLVKEQEAAPEKKPVRKPISDAKELFLNEGQIAELDCMPIKLYVKHLGAESNVDGQANKYYLDGFHFVTDDQKWFDFNNQKGGVGSLSFVSHYIRVKNNLLDNENSEISQEIRNSTFDILNKIFELKEYQEDLSSWIKEETAKNKVNSVVEETSKPKRTRKPKEVTQVEQETQKPAKKVVKKTVKKPVVVETPLVEKPVAKKTTKKVVKAAVEETFATPETKTRKPKV